MNEEENKIFSLLRGVLDPELMVNIIDLGLVYKVRHDAINKKINIEMTLTSPGCPLGEMITTDARELLRSNYKDFVVEIILVWEPGWSPEMLTEEGKIALGKH